MSSCNAAASAAVRACGPIWSNDEAIAINPYRDTEPYVGFVPTVPVNAAGSRIEPPVSLPSAHGAINAATAAAGPPPDPPGTRLRSHGFRVTPNAEYSVVEPIANSSMLVLPKIGSLALRIVRITVAS